MEPGVSDGGLSLGDMTVYPYPTEPLPMPPSITEEPESAAAPMPMPMQASPSAPLFASTSVVSTISSTLAPTSTRASRLTKSPAHALGFGTKNTATTKPASPKSSASASAKMALALAMAAPESASITITQAAATGRRTTTTMTDNNNNDHDYTSSSKATADNKLALKTKGKAVAKTKTKARHSDAVPDADEQQQRQRERERDQDLQHELHQRHFKVDQVAVQKQIARRLPVPVSVCVSVSKDKGVDADENCGKSPLSSPSPSAYSPSPSPSVSAAVTTSSGATAPLQPPLVTVVTKKRVRMHVCTICTRQFTRAEHLLRHVKCTHDGAKEYQCMICFKKFGRHDERLRHLRMHAKRGEAAAPAMPADFHPSDQLDLIKTDDFHKGAPPPAFVPSQSHPVIKIEETGEQSGVGKNLKVLNCDITESPEIADISSPVINNGLSTGRISNKSDSMDVCPNSGLADLMPKVVTAVNFSMFGVEEAGNELYTPNDSISLSIHRGSIDSFSSFAASRLSLDSVSGYSMVGMSLHRNSSNPQLPQQQGVQNAISNEHTEQVSIISNPASAVSEDQTLVEVSRFDNDITPLLHHRSNEQKQQQQQQQQQQQHSFLIHQKPSDPLNPLFRIEEASKSAACLNETLWQHRQQSESQFFQQRLQSQLLPPFLVPSQKDVDPVVFHAGSDRPVLQPRQFLQQQEMMWNERQRKAGASSQEEHHVMLPQQQLHPVLPQQQQQQQQRHHLPSLPQHQNQPHAQLQQSSPLNVQCNQLQHQQVQSQQLQQRSHEITLGEMVGIEAMLKNDNSSKKKTDCEIQKKMSAAPTNAVAQSALSKFWNHPAGNGKNNK
ncbi:hypothetical protein HK100_001928 [Physocladia obscura]|uniref:C2H2-type domain-containing protein n=1 Tax=Physocladia obscura TaxID=109957 RepID=A0AAD5SY55_9FUNG|nr:hypothetical protein HK100_001928 [Physocladia obscura]